MTELQLYLPGILLSLSAVTLALLSPGPNVLAVIGTSMGVGRPAGLALATGVASGTFCWILLTVFGFSSLIVRYAELMIVLKVLGGLYLLWLGYKSLRSATSKHDISAAELRLEGGLYPYFKRGLTVQMSNPKAAFAMMAIVSLGLQAQAPWWVAAAIVVGTSVLSLIGHWCYALAFSTDAMVRLFGKFRRTIEATLGVFFVLAGLKLLREKLVLR